MSKSTPFNQDGGAVCSRPSDVEKPSRRAPLAAAAVVLAFAGIASNAVAQDSAGSGMEVFETFTAVGQGESRATNAITFEDLEFKIPGLSLEKSLDSIPGVNVRSTDPFGFYEFGNDIRVRSFDISRLAVTVDDVPMGSNSPRYGTPAGRVADPENMSTIKVSQGTGDVTTAAAEALGGSIMYYTRDPSADPEGLVKFSLGDFGAERLFARYDTGEIFPGFTSYLSISSFKFKAAGIPDYSDSTRLEFKGVKALEKGSFSFSYTWNDRDDFDTRSIQYDRWRALETGDPYAAYPKAVYGSNGNADLEKLAAGGYRDYRSSDPSGSRISGFLLGDYSDRGRVLGAIDYFDPSVNLGDDPNSRYYLRWRNGRMDSFLRGRLELDLTPEVKTLSTIYYQDKSNYGLFPVSRGDSRGQIQNAYVQSNRDTNPATSGYVDRPDIWPQYLFRDAGGSLVPIGTAGAIPVGYNDLNADGFYSTGDTLNLTATPGAFTGNHALAARGSTLPALNGATARDEDFGAERYGTTQRVEWTVGEHKIRAGFWYEEDKQSAYRPTYMLEGDSPQGGFLYDQILFLNYDQNFSTKSFIAYVDDQFSLMEDKMMVNIGAKFMDVKRQADGQLTTPTWWRDATASRGGTFKDSFLPQLGATYTINNSYELFGSYAENLAAPDYGVIASDTFTSALLPERSENFDFGVRYSGKGFSATLAGFLNLYEDRILSIALTTEELAAAGLSGVTGVTNYRNVGGIEAKGAELAFDWTTPIESLKLVGSLAYQEATFKDNIRVGTSGFHSDPNDFRSQFYNVLGGGFSDELTKGKTVGNTPEITASVDARYSLGGARFSVGGKYYDDVYVNTLNTEKVPSYTVFNASVAYGFPADHKLEAMSFTVTVDNVFDKEFFYAGSYNGSFNGNVRADYGRNMTFTVQTKF